MSNVDVTFGAFPDVKKTEPYPLSFVAGDEEKEFTISADGTMKRICLKMPSFSGAVVTGSITLTASDGTVIYEKTGMAEDDEHVRLTDETLCGETTVKVTLSTNPLSSGICHVSLWLEGQR